LILSLIDFCRASRRRLTLVFFYDIVTYFMRKTAIGIIGFGNMGAALGHAMQTSPDLAVTAYDIDRKKLKNVKSLADPGKLVRLSDVVILAIKPQDMRGFLLNNRDSFIFRNSLVISIAAGLTIGFFESILGPVKVVRAMPNLPAKVREAMTYLCAGKYAGKKDLALAKKIFQTAGEVVIGGEDKIDAFTALCGSGPGFVFYLMDAFYRGGRALGFSRSQAKTMITQVFTGSGALASSAGEDFSSLAGRVASKGGTTRAGLDVLDKEKTQKHILECLKSARRRSRDISRVLSKKKGEL